MIDNRIDELGYVQFDKAAATWLFQLLCQRYEHRSTITPATRPFPNGARPFSTYLTVPTQSISSKRRTPPFRWRNVTATLKRGDRDPFRTAFDCSDSRSTEQR